MPKTAEVLIAQARAWIGCKESDGSHRKIIDMYNSHKPLARGYKVKYTDAWCATFVSSCAIKTGMTDIIPTECGCGEMVKLFQKLGEWDENDARVPKPGDIIFYDWQDTGSGDNTGNPDHVGIVEKISGNMITVIEGNKNDAVGRRTLKVNGRYIRGYGVPKYVASVPDTGQIKTVHGTVGALNFRCHPSVKAARLKSIPQIPEGAQVKVLRDAGGGDWCYIMYQGKHGYVSKRYLV